MRWKRTKSLLKAGSVAGALALVAGLAAAWLVPLPARLGDSGSRVVEYADGTPMCVFLSPDDKWRVPVTLGEVDPDFIAALVAFEDGRYYYHPGIDPLAMMRAAGQNARSGRVVSGGSTLTMQLARIWEPRPRTVRSKLIESARAAQLTLRLGKAEVLEYYLQYAPYGRNIEGVEAASLAFFGHRAAELSPFEIAYLLSVPQRPADRFPAPGHAEDIERAVARVTERLAEEGVFGEDEARSARAGTAPAAVRPFPREALHVAIWLAGRNGGARVRSAIRRDAQRLAERSLLRYRDEYAERGAYNGAVAVVEVATGEVVAAVGNFDFWDRDHQGQVPGFLAARSPGSAMKPFIYARAIDRGLALPEYLVPDVPVSYLGYEPINFDRDYRGLVRLDEALSLSLNVPFVNLLSALGMKDYLEFLGSAGLSAVSFEPGRYGLSLSVGGLEVRPAELANLYAMLARGGEFRPLRWTADRTVSGPRRLLSPGAAWLTRQALQEKDRPDFPARRTATGAEAEIFWKTGTSSRHRDAWAAGGGYGYAAAVWIGNFNGRSSNRLTGSEAAGPILFDVLEGLATPGRASGDPRPDDLIEVSVCEWSGRIAGPHCPHTRAALAPRGSVPRETCPFHAEYLVDADTGLQLNPLCAAGHRTERRPFLVLPASIRRWSEDHNLAAPAPPAFDPACRPAESGRGPRVFYPEADAVFFLAPGLAPDRQEIKLEAEAGADAGELFWFVDGRFLRAARSSDRGWLTPSPGAHAVRVEDQAGRGHTVRFTVIAPGS